MLLAGVSYNHPETKEERIIEIYVIARSVNQVQSGIYHVQSNQ